MTKRDTTDLNELVEARMKAEARIAELEAQLADARADVVALREALEELANWPYGGNNYCKYRKFARAALRSPNPGEKILAVVELSKLFGFSSDGFGMEPPSLTFDGREIGPLTWSQYERLAALGGDALKESENVVE